jgi:hypothetical protein
MLLVEERAELRMEGLDLSLGRAAEESMALGEFDRVSQHVKLALGLRLPVLMDVVHHAAPGVDIRRSPVAREEEQVVQASANGRGWSGRPWWSRGGEKMQQQQQPEHSHCTPS